MRETNNVLRKILGFLVFIIIVSCNSENKLANKNEIIINKNFLKDSLARVSEKLYHACDIIKNIDGNLSVINNNAEQIIKGNDECVLALLDSLTLGLLNKRDPKYLQSLDIICKVSDGYVSEYYMDISLKLFYRDFDQLFNYIYQKKNDSENCLRDRLIEAISMEISDADNSLEKRKEIDVFIINKSKELGISKDQENFLANLKSQFRSLD